MNTIRVVCDECPDGFMRINEADFDPKVHEKFDGDEGSSAYAKMTKPQLVEQAEERGLDADGTKAEIIARLEAADAQDE